VSPVLVGREAELETLGAGVRWRGWRDAGNGAAGRGGRHRCLSRQPATRTRAKRTSAAARLTRWRRAGRAARAAD